MNDSALSRLTPAERDVARLAAAGLSNGAVARDRGTSLRTVANQMAAILRKLRVGSRYELTALVSASPVPGAERATPAVWRGLTDGRLRIVERFERDGWRYYVVRDDGEPRGPLRSLDERERRLAEIMGAGQSEKAASYALGITQSAVSSLLRSTLTKLGVRSRIELVQLVRSLQADVAA